MLDGPLVFVDVDTQSDFLSPGGALFLPGSEAIHGALEKLTNFARRNGVPVIATACAHTEEDVEEIARFGPHCMVGTAGLARIKPTEWPGGQVLGPVDAFEGSLDDLPAHLTIEKRDFDVFTHPQADRLIAAYGRNGPTFVVYGVATDYCVRVAVLGLLARGYKVAVVVDAIRAIDPDREWEALREFTDAGALLTMTDVICGE